MFRCSVGDYYILTLLSIRALVKVMPFVKILIAEDDDNTGELYMVALGARGHEVMLTKNGKDCLTTYKAALKRSKGDSKKMFDVVVLDYSMPVMDGLEAAKRILELKPDQRLIFASAHVADTLAEALRELRMVVELLPKPFAIQDLVNIIEDKKVYEQLSRINVDIKHLKTWNPDHNQLAALLEQLTRLRSTHADIKKIIDVSQ